VTRYIVHVELGKIYDTETIEEAELLAEDELDDAEHCYFYASADVAEEQEVAK
jgi:hypothetical protein